MTSRATTTIRRYERVFPVRFPEESMTPVHWGVAGLAAITGVVHLYLWTLQPTYVPFLFASAIFFGAIVAMLALPYGHLARRAIYALGIPFTAGQIYMWYAVGMPDFALGVADKVVQVTLIVGLLYLLLRER